MANKKKLVKLAHTLNIKISFL